MLNGRSFVSQGLGIYRKDLRDFRRTVVDLDSFVTRLDFTRFFYATIRRQFSKEGTLDQ